MQKVTLTKILYLTLIFLATGIGNVFAQKPTWTIPVIVYVDQATANVYGGPAGIEPKIIAQFQEVNQFYSAEPRFNGIHNFVPMEFRYFTDGADNDNKAMEIFHSPLEAGYMLRIIYDQFPKIRPVHGGYGNYTILWSVDPASYWSSTTMFDPVMTKGVIHETGHSRGASDIYAGMVLQNNIIYGALFNSDHAYKSIMNGLAVDNPGWDINSIYMINKANGQLVTGEMWNENFNSVWPSSINVRVRDQHGNPISGVSVTMYGVRWIVEDGILNQEADNVFQYSTNAQGLVPFNGTDPASNPFQINYGQNSSKFANMLVVVTYNGETIYQYMPYYEVQNVKILGGNSYTVDFSFNVTNNCTSAAWNSTIAYVAGQTVSYNGNSYKAKWWTLNERPDLNIGDGKPWALLGPCGSGGGCSAPQWTVGNSSYVQGTVVKNTVNGVVKRYRCEVAGWCQSIGYDYEPGNGWAGSYAWTDLGACTAKVASSNTSANSTHVYPNPAEGSINIDLGQENVSLKVEVINNLGIEVLSQEMNSEETLDVSSLPSGVYTVKLSSGDNTWMERVVKK